MKTLALVDADSIYFRAAYKLKKNEVRKTIDEIMKDIEGQTFMGEMRVAIKGEGNWRKDYWPNYKSNRSRDYKPELKAALNYGHQYMEDKYDAVRADGMEADDLVCIWAYEAREMEIPYIIAGIDKDLKQIPGNHYNFGRREHEFIDDDDAAYNLYLQCLTGDAGDNIPGIKGIGPKKAEGILRNVPRDRMWNRVRAAWRGHATPNPDHSRRLLQMIKTWEEFDGIAAECEALIGKQDVLSRVSKDS